MTYRWLAAALLTIGLMNSAPSARAFENTYHNANARWRAGLRPWHGHFYEAAWGQPVALVVPPTAELQTDYSWGVPATRVTRIDHQFHPGWPGPGPFYDPYGFYPTPPWPSDTTQFGVYYVRGPW
jgi:hypothetical protein